MRLIDLLRGFEFCSEYDKVCKHSHITGITADSRKVGPGFLFAALPGGNLSGLNFIQDALSRGAVAIMVPLTDSPYLLKETSISIFYSENIRRDYSKLVGKFYKPYPENISAVTGTNGKTSVIEFTRQLLKECGLASASYGTLGLISRGSPRDSGLTTPDPSDLYPKLSELEKNKVNHVAIEASSHGLDQYRLDGLNIKVAAFTNFSQDHLDYHQTMERYFTAKLRLFSEIIDPNGIAVINADDKKAYIILDILTKRNITFITYGKKATDIILRRKISSNKGQIISINVVGEEYKLEVPFIADFQIYNALCALGIVIANGVNPKIAISALEKLEGVIGRLQLVSELSNGARIYVDYAHTPDAISNVLLALRKCTTKKLNIVFGCGGNRDRDKRAKMGKIASNLADEVVVTDDNPRDENASDIRSQIIKACPGAIEIGDRRQAIKIAIGKLSDDDLLVITGKGHEKNQIIKDQTFKFDDIEEIRKIMRYSI